MVLEGGENMFAKNLRYLREKYDLTQKELARRMGCSAVSTVTKWETGDNKPRYEGMVKLAQIFNVSVDDLMYKDLSEPQPAESSQSVRIKVYGSVPAGIALEAIEDVVGWEDIPKEWTTGGREYFALKVRGDSMSPKYLNGDTIICRKQCDCESGQDCVVYVNGYDATLKRVIKGNGVIVLQPINPIYETKVYTDGISIAGTVVEIRRIV